MRLAALSALALTAACADREVILPGERVGLREVLDGPTAMVEEDVAPPENRAEPISLPPARANADWLQAIGTPRFRPEHPALGSALELAWSAPIGDGDTRRRRIATDPVVADGRIFTLDSRAQLVATSSGGQTLWSRDLTPPRDREGEAAGGGLAVGGGRLYVTSGYGIVSAFDPASGNLLWEQRLRAPATGAPTYFDGVLYLVAGDSSAWAIEADDGRVRWQIDAVADVNNVAGGPAPALGEDLAVFAFGTGEMQAVFRKGGLRRWNAIVSGERRGRTLNTVNDITGAPVIQGDRVYAGSHSGRLVAIDLESGERLWTIEEGAVGTVWPAGGALFFINDRNQLLRVDAADGSRVWAAALPGFTRDRPRRQVEIYASHGPVLAGGRVIVASGDGTLRVFDPRDGGLVQAVEIPGGATTAPVVAGGTLYVVSRNGRLHAFR